MLFVAALLVAAGVAMPQPPAMASVSGYVLDALSEPVPLAEVWITAGSAKTDVVARTTTDGSGMFVFGRLPAGDGLVVRATAEGKTEAATAATTVARLRLCDAGTIRGRVLDADGAALAGAEVLATFDDGRGFSRWQARRTTSAADGGYELHKVPLGMIDVRAAAPGRVMAAARVHLHDTATCDLVVADGDGVQVTVRVDGLRTEDLGAVEVELMPYRDGSLQTLPDRLVRGRPDANGVWRSAGLPDWEYMVRASGEVAWFSRETKLRAGGAPHAVTLRARRRGEVFLTGHLTDLDGKPLQGETVGCIDHGGRGQTKARTGEDGSFRIECAVPAGDRCTLYLSGSDRTLEGGPYVSVAADPEARIELRAAPTEWARVQGRVLDAAGEPLRLQQLRLEDEQANRVPRWSPFAWTWTDVAGNFAFDRQQPRATVRVAFSGLGGAGMSEPFALDCETEREPLQLRAVAPANVEGIVRDAAGKPVPGARVWLLDAGSDTSRLFEVLTDRAGRYRHAGVPPGKYCLRLLVDGNKPGTQTAPFELRPGQRQTQDL